MVDLERLITRLKGQMSRGQLVLFTGAGFSMGARDRSKTPLPSASDLRDLLFAIAYPGDLPEQGTTLSDAFAVALRVNRREVQTLLERRLAVDPDSLPDYYRLYFSLPWYRVYTLNIDDLESAAARRFELKRTPVATSATTLITDAEKRPGAAQLEVVHLNGALSDPPESLTFSDAQYGSRTASPDSWYTRCVIDLRSRPVIYVGTDLNESTLWQHIELRRRQGVESEIMPPGSILVTPTISRARVDMLRAFNVEWVPLRAEDFATEVLQQLTDAAVKGFEFLRSYDESFGRTGLPLVSELTTEGATTATEYLMGEEPIWADLIQGRAATRVSDTALAAHAKDILEGRREKTALAVTGTAGTGKSTALKRLALDLSNQGLPVLWVDRDSQASPAIIRRRIAEFEDRVVLAMDDADTFGQHLLRLLRDLVPSRPNLLFVFGMRSTKYDDLSDAVDRIREFSILEHEVPSLSDDDIDSLIATLDKHNKLGILKGADAEQRRAAFREKCGRQLLVAMIEATSGQRFDEKVIEELEELNGLQKFVYSVLCVAANQRHYLTRDEVLLACQGLQGDGFEALTLLVRHRIVVANPPAYQHRPRHPVVTDLVFERLREHGQLGGPIKALVYALASKASPGSDQRDRVWRLLARLINHDFLWRTLNLADSREIYQQIETLMTSDYHYWLQRGSLEVEHGELKKAELFLNHAHSLAPGDFKVDTEYGYLLMRKGIEVPQDGRASAWVDQGIQLLEGVIGTRGEQDYYPYHVLGSQGLAWARRSGTSEERRRLLLYFENVVLQGTRKHPRRRDLDQLLASIRHDLLSTIVPSHGGN